jgi:hypothetical protein
MSFQRQPAVVWGGADAFNAGDSDRLNEWIAAPGDWGQGLIALRVAFPDGRSLERREAIDHRAMLPPLDGEDHPA